LHLIKKSAQICVKLRSIQEVNKPMALSGQKTVTSAGTAVALGSQLINGPLMVKALSTNTGTIAIGNDGAGDVTVSNGMLLLKEQEVYFSFVGNLSSLMIDSSVDAEGVAWLKLEV
jgi:hypothetical protein